MEIEVKQSLKNKIIKTKSIIYQDVVSHIMESEVNEDPSSTQDNSETKEVFSKSYIGSKFFNKSLFDFLNQSYDLALFNNKTIQLGIDNLENNLK